jgi:hypothetical protein
LQIQAGNKFAFYIRSSTWFFDGVSILLGAPLAPPSFAHMQTCEHVKGDELYVITRRECSLDEIRHYGSRCTLQTLIRCRRSDIALALEKPPFLFVVIVETKCILPKSQNQNHGIFGEVFGYELF